MNDDSCQPFARLLELVSPSAMGQCAAPSFHAAVRAKAGPLPSEGRSEWKISSLNQQYRMPKRLMLDIRKNNPKLGLNP